MSHWYTSAAEPMHEMPNEAARKRGDANATRETTLRDARKLQLNPSVTTVTKIIDKGEMLLEWLVKQALYSAAVHPDGWPQFELDENGMLSEKHPGFLAWAGYCRGDSKRQVQIKAERGTILHDMMMKANKAPDSVEPQYLAHVDGMMAMLERTFGKREWICEQCFAHRSGFGGSIDLRAKAVGIKGEPNYLRPIILDYKFKDFGPDREASYFVYDEHKMQLGGYSIGVDEPDAKLYNAFGSISDPGLVLLHEHSDADADHGRAMFRAALAFWQAKHQYIPKWPE